jgi:hypothetical protein
MRHGALNPFHAELSCDSCGQLPEPPRTRLTLANVAAMLPIELLVHALVIHADWSYLVKVLILTVTATVLVIWVAEPSASRLLRRWLHAPALHRRKKLHSAQALWHARTTLADRPGALERVTHALSCLDINILSIQVHPVRGGVLDEFVLAGPGGLTEQDLLEAFAAGGGSSSRVMPTTPIALADGQTSALTLAARIAGNPRSYRWRWPSCCRLKSSPRPEGTPAGDTRRMARCSKSPPLGINPSSSPVPGTLSLRPNPPEPTGWRNWPRS